MANINHRESIHLFYLSFNEHFEKHAGGDFKYGVPTSVKPLPMSNPDDGVYTSNIELTFSAKIINPRSSMAQTLGRAWQQRLVDGHLDLCCNKE